MYSILIFYITYVHAHWSQNRDVHGIRNSHLCLHTLWSSLVRVLFSLMNYLTITGPLDPYFPFLNRKFLISSLISFLAHIVGICMVGYNALINCCRLMDSCTNLSLLYRRLGHQPLQWAISWKGGVMGQTSAKLTLPARTHAGAWDDCYDEPCKHKECNRHLWIRLYGLHTSSLL